jgi:sarcosine oxidase subunit gamma
MKHRRRARELPLEIGTVSVREVQTSMHLLAPYRGQAVQAAAAFNTKWGWNGPVPMSLSAKVGSMRFWFDHAHIAVMGATPSTRLARHAAVRDVGDGWTVLELNGADVRDVLARLTPLDLRVKQCKTGMSQRSSLMHMQAVISCLASRDFG